MATFSVEITDELYDISNVIYFAGNHSGYKDITIIGMPQAGVSCTLIGADASRFGFRIPGSDTNVYRVYTTGYNNTISNYRATFRLTNNSDSTDFVNVSLTQVAYRNRAKIIGMPSEYSNIFALPSVGAAQLFCEYTSPSVLSYAEVYVDGYESLTVSDNWISANTQTAYTDTGFKVVQISVINNYEGFRSGTVSFASNGDIADVYQNAYPSSTAGCTSPIRFARSGGTIRVTLNHSSDVNVSDINVDDYEISVTSSMVPGTSTETYFDITAGARQYDEDLKGVVYFSDTNGILGFAITNQDGADTSSLVVDPTVLTYPNTGGARVLDVEYDTSLTTNESNMPSWLTYQTVQVDSSHRSYTITAAQNTSSSARDWDFVLTDANMSVTVPVSQGGTIASLSISPTSNSVSSLSGSVQITVTSTGISDLQYSISGSWITYGGKSGDVYTFNYAASSSASQRTGMITFSGGGLSKTYTLSQAAAEQIIVSPSSENVNSGSGIVRVTVTGASNIQYSISDSWLTYSSKVGDVYTFTYPRNTNIGEDASRTATVTFSAEGYISGTYVLTQAGIPPSLSISPTSNSVSSAAGSVQITVTALGISDVQYSISDSWITYSGKSGDVYTFNYDRKGTTGQRTGMITFSGGGLSDTYTLIQEGIVQLSVSPSSLTFDYTGGYDDVTVVYNGDLYYDTSVFPSWLSITEVSSSTGQKVLRLTAASTTETSSRTYNVLFQDDTNDVTLEVNQEGRSASFSVNPQSLLVNSEGGSTGLTFNNVPSGGLSWVITYGGSSTEWLSVSFMSSTVADVLFTSNSGTRRNAVIRFYNQDDSDDYVEVPVVQNGVEVESIWMDNGYSPSSFEEGENYHYILKNRNTSDILFEGISVPLSDQDYPLGINVPRLVDSYISSNKIDDLHKDMTFRKLDGNILIDFINANDPNNQVVVKTFNYWNDWSGPGYNTVYDTTRVLNDPINHKGCTGMVIPFCVYDDESADYSVVETKKNESQVNYPLGVPSDSFVYAAGEFFNAKSVSFKKGSDTLLTYDMDNCGRGYVIYRNRFGGWDSFLIEGNIYKYDEYTRLNGVYPKYPNGYGYSREKMTDRNTIRTRYEISTGWLTDEQAERLVFHLMSSTTVGLRSFSDRTMGSFPYNMVSVSIVDSSVEYKKFRNGKKMINYIITLEENDTKQVQR